MAVSLETRVPLLDHRVAEFAFSLSGQLKTRDGELKWPLRQLAFRKIPRALLDRPKMGFGVAMEQWLKGRLRPWAEDLIALADDDEVLDATTLRRMWREHQDGVCDWQAFLWRALSYLAWKEAHRDPAVTAPLTAVNA